LLLPQKLQEGNLGFSATFKVNEDTPSFKMSPRNLLLQFVLGHTFAGVYRLDYTKFQFIWPSGFRGEYFKKSANQKQELPVAAMCSLYFAEYYQFL
jgi:hypothetical protein